MQFKIFSVKHSFPSSETGHIKSYCSVEERASDGPYIESLWELAEVEIAVSKNINTYNINVVFFSLMSMCCPRLSFIFLDGVQNFFPRAPACQSLKTTTDSFSTDEA